MEKKDIFLSVCSPDTVHIGSTLDNSAQSPFLCPLTERLLMTVSIIDMKHYKVLLCESRSRGKHNHKCRYYYLSHNHPRFLIPQF